jgi:DNA-binding MarR family transcriptional regulator
MPPEGSNNKPDETTPLSQMQAALHRVLVSLVFRAQPDSPFNEMPISQLKCFHVIGEHEGMKMLEISHKMEVKLPALSQIVDRLVKRGMVERQPDPLDRRVVRLILSPQGRAIMADANARRQARMQATGNNLELEAMDKVTQGLLLLADAAEKVEAEERNAAASFAPESVRGAEIVARRSASQRENIPVAVSPDGLKGSQ